MWHLPGLFATAATRQWTSAIQHKVIIESKRARRSADETNTLIKAGVTEKR